MIFVCLYPTTYEPCAFPNCISLSFELEGNDYQCLVPNSLCDSQQLTLNLWERRSMETVCTCIVPSSC